MMGLVIPWSADERAWLQEHYPHHHSAELEAMHAEAFPDGPRRTAKAIKSRARVWKIRKAEGFVRNPPTFWTPERAEWFRAYVPGHTESEISAEHERLFGTPLTEGQIGNAKFHLGVKSGTKSGCFKKGQVPQNKGKTWDEQGISPETQAKMRKTSFKKGQVQDRPDGWIKPVGYERVSKDGYIEVKVMDSIEDGIQPKEPGQFNRNYRMKHHVVYEQHNGPIPKGCNIMFADGDKRNFDPGNLVAVPRRLFATISQKHIPFWDADSLRAAMCVAELKSTANKAKMRPRECSKCGKEFAPRYPKQRKCDPCIKIYGIGRK